MRSIIGMFAVLMGAACHHRPADPPKGLMVREVRGDSALLPAWRNVPGHEPAYFEFQVQQTALGVPGNPAPTYPAAKRAAGVEGRVLLQYVVDTTGHAEAGTVRVLEFTDPAFAQAALDVVPRMLFYPATIDGRKVRQVVQQPFVFAIGR